MDHQRFYIAGAIGGADNLMAGNQKKDVATLCTRLAMNDFYSVLRRALVAPLLEQRQDRVIGF
jgi:hypothetical protein